MAFTHILVPLDGSARSASVVPYVIDVARRFKSRVRLIAVQTNADDLVHVPREERGAIGTAAHAGDIVALKRYLDIVAEQFRERGLEVDTEILGAVDGVNGQIEHIAAASEELKAASSEMSSTLTNIRDVVEQNTAATEQMQASAGQVSQSVAAIAGVAEENSSATEEVSASAEEMNAQVEEVTAATHSLDEMAEALRRQVAQFRLNGAHSGNGSQAPGRAAEELAAAAKSTA